MDFKKKVKVDHTKAEEIRDMLITGDLVKAEMEVMKLRTEPVECKSSWELAHETVTLVNGGELIKSVKLVKDWTGLNLRQSKLCVDIIRKEIKDEYLHGNVLRSLDQDEMETIADFGEGVILAMYYQHMNGGYCSVNPDV